jgi:hypothetical protein
MRLPIIFCNNQCKLQFRPISVSDILTYKLRVQLIAILRGLYTKLVYSFLFGYLINAFHNLHRMTNCQVLAYPEVNKETRKCGKVYSLHKKSYSCNYFTHQNVIRTRKCYNPPVLTGLILAKIITSW